MQGPLDGLCFELSVFLEAGTVSKTTSMAETNATKQSDARSWFVCECHFWSYALCISPVRESKIDEAYSCLRWSRDHKCCSVTQK